ncbi:MAG: glycosyltransferase family 2 protein [Bacteroidales bacterium]|nr:glycosyltransferase family 2 protein [Bacteroidales bacterium]
MKRVLVIVVTYNGLPWLDRCLSSVTTSPSFQAPTGNLIQDVFVVDNDSTDGSADYVKSHFPAAKLVRSAENLGFSKANNLGMQYALDHGYDYVYLLNQDAWLEPGAMEKLVAAAESHPAYAVLSPLQMTDAFKDLDRQFAKIYPRAALGRKDNSSVISSGVERSREISDVKRVMAAHWLVSVKVLKEVGLFNENLFPFYGQDDNWCHRARHKGYKIGIVPQARAVHDRAQRKEDKDRLIFRNYYTGSLVRLANPNVPMWLSYLYILPFTLVKAVKYRSLKVFTSFFRLHAQFPAIRTLRSS